LQRLLFRSRRGKRDFRSPVRRREIEPPNIGGPFKFHGDLKELPHRLRPLAPDHASADVAELAVSLNLQSYPGILREMMLR
jgi:hypothetical protein